MDSKVLFKRTARLAVTAGLAASMTLGSFPVAVFADAAADPAPKPATEQEAPKSEATPAEEQKAPKAEEKAAGDEKAPEATPVEDAKTAAVPAAEQASEDVATVKIGDKTASYGALAEAVNAVNNNTDTAKTPVFTLLKSTSENIAFNKKVDVTASDGAVLSGTLTIRAAGSTVKDMSFLLDGKVQNSIVVADAATDVTVSGCVFKAPSMLYQGDGWQHNGMFVYADNFTADGNKFFFGRLNETNGESPSKDEADSAEAINLVGPLKNAVIKNNEFTVTAPAANVPTDSTVSFVIGNGNQKTEQDTGIAGVEFISNTFNGIEGIIGRFAGLSGVTSIKGEGNTIKNASHGFSVTGWQGKSDPVEYGEFKGNTFENVVQNAIVAEANGYQYASVAKAIEATKGSEATVKLLGNTLENVVIPEGKDVVLDLNGKALTNISYKQELKQVNGNWQYVKVPLEDKLLTHTITNNGTLTVKDSVGGGVVDNVSNGKAALSAGEGSKTVLDGGTFKRSEEAGTLNPEAANGNSYYTIENKGDMTINKGATVQLLNKEGKPAGYSSIIDNGWYSGSPATAGNTAKLTINGGVIEGGKYLKNDSYGTMTINGGEIKNGADASILNWNNLTVNGGTFDPADGAASVLFNQKNRDGVESGKITVVGGTFVTTGDQKVVLTSANGFATDDTLISGGTFQGNVPDEKYLDENVDIFKDPVTGEITASKYFTVTFDDGIKDTEDEVQKVAEGKTVAKPADPKHDGYTFAGWYTSADFKELYDFEKPVTADLTLYAGWHKADSDKVTEPEQKPEAQKPEAQKPADKGVLPKTGDDSALPMAVAAGAGVVAVAAGAVALKRRKQE